VFLVRAERLRRDDTVGSDLVHALGRWLDLSRHAVWNGNWQGAEIAMKYVRALYLEQALDEHISSHGSAD
jgi:hypothetical protein